MTEIARHVPGTFRAKNVWLNIASRLSACPDTYSLIFKNGRIFLATSVFEDRVWIRTVHFTICLYSIFIYIEKKQSGKRQTLEHKMLWLFIACIKRFLWRWSWRKWFNKLIVLKISMHNYIVDVSDPVSEIWKSNLLQLNCIQFIYFY